jgi:hypothetical protein
MAKLNLSEAEQELIKQDILHKEAELNRKMYAFQFFINTFILGERRLQLKILNLFKSLGEEHLVRSEFAV